MPKQRQHWKPEGFEQYPAHFDRAPQIIVPAPEPTERFIECWHALANDRAQRALATRLAEHRFLFIRGYLGNWMPGNFRRVIRGFRSLGLDARRLTNSARRSVEQNVAHQIGLAERESDAPIILLGHSRGGIEAHLLARAPSLRPRVVAVITAQTARGPSPVMQSLIQHRFQETLPTLRRRGAEAIQRLGLHLIGAQVGARDLLDPRTTRLSRHIQEQPIEAKVLHAASWSTTPTAWLDSFHERLQEIAPGVPHDGQFFLEDLIWPGLPHVLLPRVDHAQPAMGGHGFDPARFWLAMVATAMESNI